jgi:hypothetical protein
MPRIEAFEEGTIMPDTTTRASALSRGLKRAGDGAVTGAVTWTLLVHWYNVLTDSPALRDGQYVMLPIVTAPTGAIVGGIAGFILGITSGSKETADE